MEGNPPVVTGPVLQDKETGVERNWAADPPRKWKFSWRWLTKRLNCTEEGITGPEGCGGCCISQDYWPPSAGGTEYGYMCPMLGDNGCSFSIEDRPIVCLMYPLTVAPSGTVGLMVQATRSHGPSAPCYKAGPMIIDSLRNQLIAVIGESEYWRVREGLLEERDVEVEVPYLVILQLAKEYIWAIRGEVPQSRSGGPQPEIVRTKPVLLPWRTRRDLARGGGTFFPLKQLLDVHIRHRSPSLEPETRQEPLL